MKRPWLTLTIAACLAALLAGCLSSENPILTDLNSDRPLPGHFVLKPPKKDEGDAELVVNLVHSTYVAVSIDGKGAPSTNYLNFKLLRDNIYILQDATPGTNRVDLYYAKIENGTIQSGEFDCHSLAAGRIKEFKIKVDKSAKGDPAKERDKGSCSVKSMSLDNLIKLMAENLNPDSFKSDDPEAAPLHIETAP
jgi:hypothetical protein